jgi:primosomal protein N' (replication factor Y)
MPVSNVGLIVVDECHEPSYKQEQAPRYSALRAASILAHNHSAKLILGSATPSLTDYYLAKNANLPIANLPEPAIKSAAANIEIVDLKNHDNFRRHRFFSKALIEKIEQAITSGHQTLLFHNRRGTSPTTMCDHCGWVAQCPNCFLPLTLHADTHHLRCHLCGLTSPIPPSCPQCHEPTIIFKGIGTKLIEEEARKLFPKARIARFDADNNPRDAVQNRYQELYDGSVDIMIGTQILAKGLDLPRLSTVGVIQADSGLVLPDYQAQERVFQLLYQVIGRVGRSKLAGHVVIQTYQPDHPVIKAAVSRDYQAFYQSELTARQTGRFPPFRYLLKLSCSYKTETGAVNASQKLASQLRKTHPDLEIFGPTPAFYERLGGAYRWQIVLKSKIRKQLVSIVKTLPPGWQADLDPISLL